MRDVKIFDEENSIIVDDQYTTDTFEFFPEAKKFEVSSSIKNDVFYNNQTIEYKISANPIELYMRTLESSHEPPKEYSIKDGVVLESEMKEKGSLMVSDRIESLKKQVEWSKIELLGNYEVNLYILSLHPEIISKEDYRKFLRQTLERIKNALPKIEKTLQEIDTTGLAIMSGPYGKQIWYPDNREIPEDKRKSTFDYLENKIHVPLFSKDSPEFSGITGEEFQSSDAILAYIEDLLNPKKIPPSLETSKGKDNIKWLGYGWTVLINIIVLGIMLALFGSAQSAFETRVYAILAVIYLSVQGFSMQYGLTTTNFASGLDNEFKRIRLLLKNVPNKEEIVSADENKQKLEKAVIKMYITIAFMLIAYLIALWNLIASLHS